MTPTPPPTPRKPARRPARAGFVGPLFRWELVRLARRGQDARARFLLAAALFVVLNLFIVCWFWGTDPGELFLGTGRRLSIEESARFGTWFALAFVLAQLAVMVLLTPAYAAGGIAEEKEKRTFPFLLMTELTNREIVFGKFLGRLAFLLGVMFAGLPVLALTQLYGGVSLSFLAMSYFLTGTTVTLLAAVGVASAAFADTFRGALFRAYGLAALHVFAGCGLHPLFSPFAVVLLAHEALQDSVGGFLALGLGYGSAQLVFAAVAVGMAFRAVRQSRAALGGRPGPPPRPQPRRPWPDSPPPVPERPRPELPPAPPRPASPPPLPREITDRPPLTDADDPFLWKETHVAGVRRDADDDSIRGLVLAGGIVVGLTVAFFALIAGLVVAASGATRAGLEAAQKLLVLGGTAGFFTYLLTVGSAACGIVCRERQRLTLESLLTIPVDRRAILGPKWRVSLCRGWWWGLPAAGSVALGLALSDARPAAIPAAAFALAAVPAAVSYGLWLSVRCKTITRAVMWFLPAAGGLSGLPAAVWANTGPDAGPLAAAVMLAAVGSAVAAGWGFWRLAFDGFEQEGR